MVKLSGSVVCAFLVKKGWVFLLMVVGGAAIADVSSAYNHRAIAISTSLTLPIGVKIWFNECSGKVSGLTTWNLGEHFASLGIGHFLWHPVGSKKASLTSGFPDLVRHLRKQGAEVPQWLTSDSELLHCPWKTREEFYLEINSPKMIELRDFLQRTIPLQAEYMIKKLPEILPSLLASTPASERATIYNRFYSLAVTPAGVYAMVDYLNFKGAGVYDSLDNYKNGSGLLQVLRGMSSAPKHYNELQAYVWSAKHALIRKVERSSSNSQYEIWIKGWFKRIDTYLGNDLELVAQ